MTYDAAGNVINDGTHRYRYDAENRIICVDPDPTTWACPSTSVSYTYDAFGRRIKKSVGSSTVNYWFGPGGETIAESDGSNNYTNYIFFAGRRLARNIAGEIKYYVVDDLGSTAVLTDKSGTVLDDNDFYPWGGVVAGVGSTTSNNHYKFTGEERDTESNLDHFGARNYSNSIGRWMSPDWSGVPTPVPYAGLGAPQSLNLYAYVRNSPVTLVDPDGHDGEDDDNDLSILTPGCTPKKQDGGNGDRFGDCGVDCTSILGDHLKDAFAISINPVELLRPFGNPCGEGVASCNVFDPLGNFVGFHLNVSASSQQQVDSGAGWLDEPGGAGDTWIFLTDLDAYVIAGAGCALGASCPLAIGVGAGVKTAGYIEGTIMKKKGITNRQFLPMLVPPEVAVSAAVWYGLWKVTDPQLQRDLLLWGLDKFVDFVINPHNDWRPNPCSVVPCGH